jgi:phage repressor protein C with HTH and peptisase S24 domain
MAKPLLAQEMAQCSHISIAADELIMAPRSKPASQHTGLFYAREARAVAERWGFPENFVREQLHSLPERLVVIESEGDSMAPTIASGERVIVDVEHKTPSPDGLYALRDPFGSIIIRRLRLLRSSKPTRVKVISDNPKSLSEEASVDEIEIFGKVLCCFKLF